MMMLGWDGDGGDAFLTDAGVQPLRPTVRIAPHTGWLFLMAAHHLRWVVYCRVDPRRLSVAIYAVVDINRRPPAAAAALPARPPARPAMNVQAARSSSSPYRAPDSELQILRNAKCKVKLPSVEPRIN